MIRNYSVRVDVIRNNAFFKTLRLISDPVIDSDSSAELKTSMSGIFRDELDVNWLTDELKPYQIIDGVEYPVGVFPIGTYSKNTDENGVSSVNVEAYDRALYLLQIKTETVLHLSAGTNYMQAVEQLLVDGGISLYLATPTTEVLATDREDWEIGTPYLTIINTLLSEINYGQIWFNENGFAILQPAKTPSSSNIDHQYSQRDKVKVLKRPTGVETDAFDAPNVFVVICDNPDLEAPLVSTAVNDSPISALSTFKRGRRIVSVSNLDNIASQAALDEYTQRLCAESMLSSEIATISTANLPGHGVYDTVAIDHPDIDGIFQEISWSLVLAPGQTMIHKLRRSILI